MPGVLPTAIRDETATITARSNAANDELTKLFYMLMQRREEAERNRQMRMHEHELRRQERSEDRSANQEFWREQFERGEESKTRHFERSGAYDPKNRGGETRTSPLSPGTSGATVGGTNAPPIPPAPRTIPGSVAPIGDNTQFKTSQADTDEADIPAGATPTSYSGEGGTDEFMARQSTQGRPNVSASRIPRAPTASPRSGSGSGRGQQGQSKTLFPPIRDEIKQAWASYEQKYNLPRGILQTAMGLTNENGYNARSQPRPHDGMGGWFGTTAELRKEMNIPDGDIVDPVRMGEHAARNMRRNIDAYLKFAGQTSSEKGSAPGAKLPAIGNKVEDVPKILMLTQLGPVAGPRALATLHLNPNAPLTRVIPPGRDTDGSEQDNARALIRSGIPSNQTVGGFYKDMVKSKVDPLHTETVQGQEGMLDQQPSADQEVAPPRPSQDVPTSDAGRFLQSRGGNVTGLHNEFSSRLAHAIQVAEAATGSQAKINSLHRSPEKQAQLRANYIRAPVTYGGVTYRPNARGGLAAPPGRSNHQGGIAGDIARGPVLDYLHAHPEVMRSVGLAFLGGHAGRVDPVHIELAKGKLPPTPANAPSSQVAATTTAPTQATTATPQPQPVKKPSMYGAVSTFDAPPSPPIMTAQGMTSEPTTNRLALDVPLPTARPQVQTAAIPDDMSAAAAEPTPQTTQPVTQVTQAPPSQYNTPTTPTSAGQYADDPNERGPTFPAIGRMKDYIDAAASRFKTPPTPIASKQVDPAAYDEQLQAMIAATGGDQPAAPIEPPGAPIASKPMDPAVYKEQLQAMIAATGEGMPPVQGGWMPMPSGSSAAANANVNTRIVPKKVQSIPMTGSGQPLYPQVPPLEPELTTRPKRAGTTAATPMPSGVTFGSGNVMPPPPGAKVYTVDPNTGRIIPPGGAPVVNDEQQGQATVDPMLEVTDEEQ